MERHSRYSQIWKNSWARLFLGQDVRELYRQNGIEIRYAGSRKQNYGVILRGQSVMEEAR